MKTIYCIEEYLKEDEKVRDGGFWGHKDQPQKFGLTDYLQEFDDEEEFKDMLLSIIKAGGVIGRVFTKEVDDNYRPYHFDGSKLRKENDFNGLL